MRTPLIERLPPDSPQLALFDERLCAVEHRPPVRRYRRATTKAHARRWRRWEEWCEEAGYQSDPVFITAEKLSEHTDWMITVKRYAPDTIQQAVRALQLRAQQAGVHVSTKPALAQLAAWRRELEAMGLIQRRSRKNAA